jgi:DNA ligase (NAD+)
VGPVEGLRDGSEEPYVPPTSCPVCGEPVVSEEGEVAVYCDNVSCPAQVVRRIEHWVSRGAMDIAGLGIRVVQLLVAEGLISDVADLYALSREDLLPLEGFADKRVDNLLSAIATSREQPLARVIVGLGIKGVGGRVATTLTDHYRSIDDLMAATPASLEEIEGIGPEIASAIVRFFRRPRNRELIEKLRRNGLPLYDEEAEESEPGALEGLAFVITGTLPTMSREAATALIHEHGGRVTGSVSGRTAYLVVGDNPGASKYSKGEKLGVPMIGEAELLDLISAPRTDRPQADA